VILSTHILPEVQASCGRIIIVNAGRIVADDRTEALMDAGRGAVIRLIVKAKTGGRWSPMRRGRPDRLAGVSTVERTEGEGAGTLGFRVRASAARIRAKPSSAPQPRATLSCLICTASASRSRTPSASSPWEKEAPMRMW